MFWWLLGLAVVGGGVYAAASAASAPRYVERAFTMRATMQLAEQPRGRAARAGEGAFTEETWINALGLAARDCLGDTVRYLLTETLGARDVSLLNFPAPVPQITRPTAAPGEIVVEVRLRVRALVNADMARNFATLQGLRDAMQGLLGGTTQPPVSCSSGITLRQRHIAAPIEPLSLNGLGRLRR